VKVGFEDTGHGIADDPDSTFNTQSGPFGAFGMGGAGGPFGAFGTREPVSLGAMKRKRK
jgi:hypothetical protein